MTEPTLFEKIIAREIPADIVFEDKLCIAFRDIAPQAPLHVLLCPKVPLKMLSEAVDGDGKLLAHLLLTAPRVARLLGYTEGFRLVVNNGSNAGQTVFHLHLHILAGRTFDWPPG
ncbi:MAG: histidine triad nucleotide-binding protein [Gammaproteobacteria bacterium]|jgi:histidine triad (HIT) family protein